MIKLKNTSSHTYAVYLDGTNQDNMTSGTERTFEVNPGNHTVRVLQQNGYLIYATDETYTHACIAGGNIWEKNFPEASNGK